MNHRNRPSAYILKNWKEILRDTKQEMKDAGSQSMFGALFRVTGHGIYTEGRLEIMHVGRNRLVVGRDNTIASSAKLLRGDVESEDIDAEAK